MSVITPPWGLHNAGLGGSNAHSAKAARLVLAAAMNDTPGIVSGFAVTQSSPAGMSVDVADGLCVVPVNSVVADGSWPLRNDAAATVSIAAANPTNPRIDIVVMRVRDSALDGTTPGPSTDVAQLEVVAGTPAPSPVAPATPVNSLRLAQVTVPTAAISIVNANIATSTVLLAPLPVRRRHLGQAAPALSGQLGGLDWSQTDRRLRAETSLGWKIVGGEFPTASRRRDTQNVGNNTDAQILMGSTNPVTIVDTDGIITSHSMTIPAGLGGDWEIGCAGRWAPAATGRRHLQIIINNNAVTGETGVVRFSVEASAIPVGAEGYHTANKQVRLKPGAVLELRVFQSSGGSLEFREPQMWARMVNHLPGF